MTLKILYVLPPTQTYAGIERVVDEICSELSTNYGDDFNISVLFMSHYRGMPDRARRYHIIQEDVTGRLEALRVARKTVSRDDYDLVIVPQVEPLVIFWVACLGLKAKFVMYLHGNPGIERQSSVRAKILFLVMKKVLLARLAAVFGTSPKQLAGFKAQFPHKVSQYWVANPVRKFATANYDRDDRGDTITFVNVGRFSYQKGQDILISAFSKLYEQRKTARLVIVGYGADEAKLREMIGALGLDGVVDVRNLPEDPGPALAKSDVYVSASRWEGWSLAICEALRFGLPVVATDCEFGPSDILTDARLGRLVPLDQEGALARAMAYYCDNLEEERAHADLRRRYINRFDVEAVAQEHATALLKAHASAPHLAA